MPQPGVQAADHKLHPEKPRHTGGLIAHLPKERRAAGSLFLLQGHHPLKTVGPAEAEAGDPLGQGQGFFPLFQDKFHLFHPAVVLHPQRGAVMEQGAAFDPYFHHSTAFIFSSGIFPYIHPPFWFAGCRGLCNMALPSWTKAV